MDITVTIPAGKVAEFKSGFLKSCPVPVDPDTLVPEMTETQWLKAWIVSQLRRAYREGKKRIAAETATTDEGVLT